MLGKKKLSKLFWLERSDVWCITANTLTVYCLQFCLYLSVHDSHVIHFPWGLPDGGAGREGCILTHKEFVIGYSTYLRIPLWVGHQMDGEVCLFIRNYVLYKKLWQPQYDYKKAQKKGLKKGR